MEQKILSIGIAAYNMEKYLRRCIDSLLIPEIDKLEIIIANNASTDSTPEIAQEYYNKYPNSIKVINIDVNGHYGKAVNHALKNATGKYFKLLDADDWYDTKGLSTFVNVLSHSDVDLIITNMSEEFADGRKSNIIIAQNVEYGKIIKKGTNEFRKTDFYANIGMHKIAYRTSLLHNMHFTMTENIPYVDTEYAYYPIKYINSVLFVNIILYKYFIGREGQTIENNSMIKNSPALLKVITKMLNNYTEEDTSSEIQLFNTLYVCKTLSTYYHIKLILQPKNKYENRNLRELDSLVKAKGNKLYKTLGEQTWHNIPCIQIWRKTSLHIIPTNLYCFLKRLYKAN